MSLASRCGWFGLGCLVLAACNTTAAEPDTQSQRRAFTASNAGAPAQDPGAAGQPALTDEELDRLLDALEQELESQGTNR